MASRRAARAQWKPGADGGTAPAILNAANEVAVSAFLQQKIGFMDIPRMIESVLEAASIQPADTLDSVIAADQTARDAALELLLVH